jgi:outer membrane protein TolC
MGELKVIRRLMMLLPAVVLAGCAVEPQPLSQEEVATVAAIDLGLIAKSQEPVSGPLTLDAALSRALKYNLDHRSQLMEQALAQKNLDLVKMDMLPVMVASAGYYARSNYNASSSMSVLTFTESLEPSTSVDRERATAGARFSWNILDFGVSYYQARQEANRYLIAEKAREKVMMRLLRQTRAAYYRVATLQSLEPRITALAAAANASLADLKKVREKQLRAPLAVLQDYRQLTELVQQLEQMHQIVSAARTELATLINVFPGTPVTVAPIGTVAPPRLAEVNLRELEKYALVHSGDYVSEFYKLRIDQDESRKALLRLLPGMEVSGELAFDTNHFLWNNLWAEASTRLTWNIFRLIAYPRVVAQNDAKVTLDHTRRLAMNMAVIARLNLAWQEYQDALVRFDRASDINAVDADISALTTQASTAQAVGDLARIQSEVRALRSALARMLAFADTQDSYGAFLTSLGLNPVPADYQTYSVDDLAKLLGQRYDAFATGPLPKPPAIPLPDGDQDERAASTYHAVLSTIAAALPKEAGADIGLDDISREVGKVIGDWNAAP